MTSQKPITMIQPNELRVGNYVYNTYGHKYEVLHIHRKKRNSYHPIPLNEDWLIKLGYKLDITDIIRKRYTKDSLINNVIIAYEGKLYFHSWFGNIHIEYVHRLQNLCFELENKELTIK